MASALRFIAKVVLGGGSAELGRTSMDEVRGNLGSDRGGVTQEFLSHDVREDLHMGPPQVGAVARSRTAERSLAEMVGPVAPGFFKSAAADVRSRESPWS